MTDKNFFHEQMEQSKVKSEIVCNYFSSWVQIMKKRTETMAYIDLFSGPGSYQDGSQSTPILILKKAVENPEIGQKLVTIFNDVDPNNNVSLSKAIQSIPHIKNLKYPPRVLNLEVGEEIIKILQREPSRPTLFFIDPWGYKGLSTNLLRTTLKNWGCDCIFFFNYNRINMALSNTLVEPHMKALFGEEKAKDLRERLPFLSPEERESEIIQSISQVLKEVGGEYFLPFPFLRSDKEVISHHLIFTTKNKTGYNIMREIMAKKSSSQKQGVPSLEYNPTMTQQLSLFDIEPLDELGEMLLHEFSGQTLTVKAIYEQHSIGKNYILKNYKDVLKKLEREGKIIAEPSSENRPKNTMGDQVEILFLPW